ncbi:nephronectin isoform X3 [Heteronotia binoei]|uniref:nephronectin isoform X3 n=1 Tax=Heteronotia binoei TaxID=13085 RepID=UPI002930680F|nr:nephronectin isoform X3 [Heteronotia binoei]
MDLSLRLLILCWLYLEASGEFDGRWPRQIFSTTGLCRFGSRVDCCWGWVRHSWGQCQPVCQPGCKHGECIGPNKCKCQPGYTGKTCNQAEHLYAASHDWPSEPPFFIPLDHQAANLLLRDLNECGLKPRPCKHRCMNTYGSYKCYCLNGYMLMPDGSCSNALTCSMANCQYGCDVVKGEVRCRCPSPGLQLAPDGRTCIDVDECATGRVTCPRFRKCVNTFGSYICKCHKGFDLMYIGGKYQCHDIDECSLDQHQCRGFSRCYNTQGSYKCKCKEGYRGDGMNCMTFDALENEMGFDSAEAHGRGQQDPFNVVLSEMVSQREIWAIPKVMIDPSGPYTVFKGNSTFPKGSGGMTNRIPETGGTKQPVKIPHVPATARPVPRTTIKPTPHPTTRPTQKPFTRFVTKPATTKPAWKPATKLPPVTRPLPPTRPPTPPLTPPKPTTTQTPRVTTKEPQLVPTIATPPQGFTVDNRIPIDPQKPRGDVFIPRQPGVSNNLFETFEIERGISADEDKANDDPGVFVHSCNFDSGLCRWMKEKDEDLHWESVKDASGGQYLSLSEPKGKTGRAARLVLPLGHLGHSGNLCLSFRHKVSGLHSGLLQVFVRKSGAHGPAIWGRNSGHGWRQTQITLQGPGIKSVIFKGEKGKGRTGEIGLDDVSLRRGHCSQDH